MDRENSGGIGRIEDTGKEYGSDRLSYLIFNVDIQAGLCVWHSCVNTICVNPSHLWAGTKADNSMDSVEKGRENKGEAQRSAKLTEGDVREIRALGGTMPYKDIADMFKISVPTVGEVVRCITWKHIN